MRRKSKLCSDRNRWCHQICKTLVECRSNISSAKARMQTEFRGDERTPGEIRGLLASTKISTFTVQRCLKLQNLKIAYMKHRFQHKILSKKADIFLRAKGSKMTWGKKNTAEYII